MLGGTQVAGGEGGGGGDHDIRTHTVTGLRIGGRGSERGQDEQRGHGGTHPLELALSAPARCGGAGLARWTVCAAACGRAAVQSRHAANLRQLMCVAREI
jgi:hypothetical protein